uniref:Uncharacterized protein n=1 Tax=uncultured bacterium contig00052 TaxID=1181536 RepID=A0A806KHD9_9BACT|nr:hypothetical protein [uncultured bacterium contig00052]
MPKIFETMISVLSAKHVERFAVDITFSDGKVKRVDIDTKAGFCKRIC